MRKLLSTRPQPYYIYAPNYRRSSSGIRVMHMLCDALIRSGYEAYVTARVLSDEFMTPLLTEEVVDAHRAQGLEPIVVYPEVIDGNPLKGGVVVRYILNRPGFIEGSGAFGEDDILYAYSRDLLMPGIPDDRVMLLPPFDLGVFRLPDDPGKRVPGKVCYYRGRRGELHIDPSLLPPDAVEITPHWPSSWEDMADLFQQCEIFYCGGSSALGTEAVLCGCLCVVIVEEGAPRIGVYETQSHGAAWGTAPEELERARRTLPLARDNWLRLEKEFWPALDHFIDVTQEAALERRGNAGRYQLQEWLAERVPTKRQSALISQRLEQQAGPSFGLLVIDEAGAAERLMATIKSLSLERSLYASTRILAFTTAEVPKTSIEDKLHFIRIEPGSLVAQINAAVAASTFDWLMLVEAGEEFTPSGLMRVALELMDAPDCRALYGDELQRIGKGNLGAALRPAFNLDMLLSFPAAMARHWLFRRDLFLASGGFDAACEGALELDLLLRLIEQDGIVGLGHVPEPLLTGNAPRLQDNPAELAAIQRHLQARGYAEAHVGSAMPGRYLIDYGHPQQPSVSIVLAMHDHLEALQRCVDSLLEKTRYGHYELLIVDTAGSSEAGRAWLAGVEALGDAKVRVLRYPHPYNASAVANLGAAAARGEYLLLLDSDTVAVREDWLEHLLNHAQRPEVGVVGGRLLHPDGKVHGAGLILGLNGPAAPAFANEPMDAAGYMQRLQLDQDFSAVSAACLMVRRSLFEEVGGMDEAAFQTAFHDVDLCLKVREAGYLTVWTPHAVLVGEGGRNCPQLLEGRRQREVQEQDALYARWLPQLANDPAYNRCLSLSGKGFELEMDSNLSWRPLSWRPLPVVLAHQADPWGCGNYRIIKPFAAMKEAGLVDGMLSEGLLQVVDLERYNPDSIVLQRQIGDERLEAMRRIKAFSRAFKVYELDDYLPNLPMKSVHREHMPKDILKSLRRGLGFVDRFVVSTQPLAEAFAGLHDDIRVVENRLPLDWWGGLHGARRRGQKPRVGWAGGASHTGDLELLLDVVRELAGEVEWVFFGMCPEKLQPYVKEVHAGVDIDRYPAALAALNLDLAIAPVEQNLFNECKSNLRLLEYGACGFPVVCSDLVCYQGDLPVTRVKNRFRDWVEAIRMHINDLDAAAAAGDELRRQVMKHWMLSGENLQRWHAAWLPD